MRNDNIGDVICTTPALDALRRAFPSAHIAALVCTLAQEAVEGHRALDALHVYPKAKHKHYGALESHLRLARTLARVRRERFDLVLAFRADFSTSQAWLAYASRGRWRAGPRAMGKRARWGFYYNLPVDHPPAGLHEVERCFHLLHALGLDTGRERLYLGIPPRAAARVDGFWQEAGLGSNPAPVAVNITRWAYRPDRLWPEERYRRLVQELAARPGGVLVTHAPADQAWVAELLAGLTPQPPVFWSPSLKEFAAVAARARVMVTAEGGPMHLAAAAGARLVVLWGRTPLATWRPWMTEHRILGGAGSVEAVSVEQVLEAVAGLPAPQQSE